MRVVATVQPGAGHLLPVVPLLHALRAAGHDVLLAGSATLAPLAERYGVPLEPVGPTWTWDDPGGLLGRPVPDRPAAQRAALAGAVDVARYAVLSDVTALLARTGADLVVHEQYEPSGALAAELSGTPCLCVGHGYSPYVAGGPGGPAAAARPPHPARAALGLPAEPDPGWCYAYADSCPPSLHPFPPVDLPLRWQLRPEVPVPAPGPTAGPPPEWADAPPGSRVLVTFGTAAAGRAALLPLVVRSARAAGGRAHVLGVPRFAPLGPLLAAADVVVTHGGSGTTVAAVAAGRPVLVLPVHDEQRYLAFRLAGAGAARSLAAHEVSEDAVEAGVRELLTDPSYRGNARRLAAEIAAMPGAGRTVDRLEALLDAGPPNPGPFADRRGVVHGTAR